MDYGIDEKATVKRKCECGQEYRTKKSTPMGVCPACMEALRQAFWATMEEDASHDQ
jgi:hypothetical protein